jgi:sensor histidine kinase YesM
VILNRPGQRLSGTTMAALAAVWSIMCGLYTWEFVFRLTYVPLWTRVYAAAWAATNLTLLWLAGYGLGIASSRVRSRELDTDRIRSLHLFIGVLLVPVAFTASRILFWVTLHRVGLFRPYDSAWDMAFVYSTKAMVLYATAMAAGHALSYSEELDRQTLLQARLRGQLTAARAQVLQAQLQPHFLFNALNSIPALARRSPEEAMAAVSLIERFLRALLDSGAQPTVSVANELTLLSQYTAIEQIRFGERLRVIINAERSCLEAQVPGLLLQPLVENAIRHGVGSRRGNRFVCVLIFPWNGALRIVVRDDGGGLPDPFHEGIGLRNTRARIADLYPRHRFEIRNVPSGGCEVLLEIDA